MERVKKQFRDTAEDQKSAWNQLLFIARGKIRTGLPLTQEEKNKFHALFCDAVLSRTSHPISFRLDSGRIVYLGKASKFVDLFTFQTREYAYIEDDQSGQVFIVSYRVLWRAFLDFLNEIVGYAHEEALHMSKEKPVREKRTSYDVGL